jgi:hypothetical protein
MSQVWIDLEETIIDSWSSGLLINHHKIKNWLDTNNIDDINIWSFAIWDEKDQKEFVSSGMHESIERVLNRKILSSVSVTEMHKLVYQYEKVRYDNDTDFMSLNGKHWSFIKFCMGHHVGQDCILIDDCVPSWIIEDTKTGGKITLINVRDI